MASFVANSYNELLMPEAAMAWVNRALELDPDHYMSYYRYAMQMKEDGKLEDAERLIRRAIVLRPMNTRLRTELAGILRLLFNLQMQRNDSAPAESVAIAPKEESYG